jgi:hypothetical protein
MRSRWTRVDEPKIISVKSVSLHKMHLPALSFISVSTSNYFQLNQFVAGSDLFAGKTNGFGWFTFAFGRDQLLLRAGIETRAKSNQSKAESTSEFSWISRERIG